MSNKLYVPKCDAAIQERHSAHVSSFQLWHERLAHIHKENVLKMAQNGSVRKINISLKTCAGVCKGCVAGKARQEPVPKKESLVREQKTFYT